jgi:hypothetical protein
MQDSDFLQQELSSLPTGGTADWNTLLNKPATFPSTWATVSGKPTLFSGSYLDLTNKPTEIELATAISSLPFFSPPKKTTAEIGALTPTEGDLVFDKTLKEWKGYINGSWVSFHTNN